ncbi:DNA circularization N-terminal domain-containing protein [Escherichia coli]|nr:DNA circularization N-terminal domain-containing protein [Escherichia coli]
MSNGKWDGLRDASFRGVPFFLVDTEGTGGRRAIPRAYPGVKPPGLMITGPFPVNSRLTQSCWVKTSRMI